MQVAYQDIYSMPIYNWFKLLDTGNLGFLNIDSTNKPPNKVEQVESETLMELWYDINNQFVSEFGQSDMTVNILEKKRDLLILKAKFVETGNKMNLTFIEIKENEIKTLTPEDNEFNYNKEVGIISRTLPTPLNTRKTSVYDYNNLKLTLSYGN